MFAAATEEECLGVPSPPLALEARDGVLHIRPARTIDDALTDEIRAVLERIPVGVPIILELDDEIADTAPEVGLVLSVVRLASATGHALAISAREDLGQRLADLGADRMVHIGTTIEECEAYLAPKATAAD
jgi:hypothetical protein